MPSLNETAEIVETVRSFSSKQIAVIIALITMVLSGVFFVENRYAKTEFIKGQIDHTKSEISALNNEIKSQVITLSVLAGQMSAIMNSSSGRVVQPVAIPANAPALTPEILERIEAERPKIAKNEAAVDLQNGIAKQQSNINEQLQRLNNK